MRGENVVFCGAVVRGFFFYKIAEKILQILQTAECEVVFFKTLIRFISSHLCSHGCRMNIPRNFNQITIVFIIQFWRLLMSIFLKTLNYFFLQTCHNILEHFIIVYTRFKIVNNYFVSSILNSMCKLPKLFIYNFFFWYCTHNNYYNSRYMFTHFIILLYHSGYTCALYYII